jgi:hypothetical protein
MPLRNRPAARDAATRMQVMNPAQELRTQKLRTGTEPEPEPEK